MYEYTLIKLFIELFRLIQLDFVPIVDNKILVVKDKTTTRN